MSNYKTYPKYKTTDIAWLGDVPEHWEEVRVKYAFDERVEKGYPNEDLLAATQTKGVVRKEEYGTRTVTAQKDFHLLKLVKVGDFVISLRSFQGGIEIAYQQGIISPAYTIMKLVKDYELRYFKHLYKSKYFINGLTTFVTGIREGQNIDYVKFRRSFLPIPPKQEQEVIAEFLDRKTAEIKQFIELKERTIALLKEQKTAIINQAVTKGLNPSVKMKDSSVEWLGEIPEHWEVKKLKYLLKSRLKYGANESAELDDRKYPRYIRITDFGDDGILKDKTFKSLKPKIANDYLLDEGDILFARSGGTVGKTFQFKNYNGKACFAGYLIKASVNKDILSDYLYLYTKSGVYEKWKDSIFNQATIQNIGADKYSILPVIRPSNSEQKSIVDFTEVKTKVIDEKIGIIKKEIKLIKEYEQSLISDVVTGKIDVRGM